MEQEKQPHRLNAVFLERWRPYFWIALGCFFLYCKTLAFKFTCFDDTALILDNLWYLKDWRHLFTVFGQTVFLGGEDFFYRPLLVVSLILDACAGGASPAVYHFTNIALHAAASCLVFVLFKGLGYGRKFAFVLALLFLSHPALSQAVAWVPGRNDSLLAVFVLAAFSSFVASGRERGPRSLLLHLLCFNLALYTKETAFQLLPLCLLYYVIDGKGGLSRGRWLGLAGGWLVSGLGWFALRSSTQAAASAHSLARFSAPEFLSDIPLSLLQYAGKTLFPFNLSGFPITRDTGSLYGILAVLVLAAALAFTRRERLRFSAFGLVWFLLFILPPFLLPDKARLEHRLYLPVIGIFIVLGEFVRSREGMFDKRRYLIIPGAVILLFSGITFVHSDIFIARLPFWESAVRSSPHSSTAHNSLGVRYLEYGKKELAAREFVTAVRLSPGNVNALINLAGLLMEQGNYGGAEKALAAALELKPGDHLGWYNLGMLRYLQGRDEEARRCWERTLECNPHYYYAYRTLAVFHALRGDPAAETYLRTCRDAFKRPVAVPAAATLKDRTWLYRYSLGE